LLVADTLSGDLAVLRLEKLPGASKISAERAMVTMIPLGIAPNAVAVKGFMTK
jgi:hypothetical protein